MNIHVADNAREAARMLLRNMLAVIRQPSGAGGEGDTVNVAFSGGSTPAILFDVWVEEFAELTPWNRFRVYWVDERCVSSENKDSNYRLAKIHLLDKIPLTSEQILRIRGEQEDAEREVLRYSSMVLSQLPLDGRIPVFDFVLLGIGADGHTSSVFPGQEKLLHTLAPYALSTHSVTGQRRIAMTGEVMVRARHTWFYVTGQDKAGVIQSLSCPEVRNRYPAAYVWQSALHAELFTDIQVISPV